jgi:hypothetical protein
MCLSNVSNLVAIATLDHKITIIDHSTLQIVHTIVVEERTEEVTVKFIFKTIINIY